MPSASERDRLTIFIKPSGFWQNWLPSSALPAFLRRNRCGAHIMGLDDSTSRMIGDIYASPFDDDAWQRFLDQLLERTGSRFLLVSVVDLKCRHYSKTLWHGAGDGRFLDGLAEYEQELFELDPLLNYAAQFPNAGFAESRGALRRLGRTPDDDPYVAFTRGQLGSGYNAVCYTAPHDGLSLGLSINLPTERRSFTAEQILLFRQVFDHLQRATWLAARPPCVEHTRDALILLNERGVVVSLSAAAERLLAVPDGLTVIGGRLHGSRLADTRRLDALIASTLEWDQPGGGSGALAIERPSGKPAWLLTSDTLGPASGILRKSAACIVLRIIERPLQSATGISRRIVQLFGLSPTEAKLLNILYSDAVDLRSAAEILAMTYSTARVHVRHILAKADVRSQTELMWLMERLGP